MIEISAAQFFSIFYFIFSLGFVLQSKEFIGAGITPDNFLSKWLQNTNAEDVQFIQHHIVKKFEILLASPECQIFTERDVYYGSYDHVNQYKNHQRVEISRSPIKSKKHKC